MERKIIVELLEIILDQAKFQLVLLDKIKELQKYETATRSRVNRDHTAS